MPASPTVRVALLVDHVESHYHQEIVRGALRAARAAQVRTLIVAGGWLGRPPEHPVGRNFIYDLLREAKVDGIAVLAGSLSNFSGLERFEQWLGQFVKLPIVTIGIIVPGVASVHADNEVGVCELTSHLIEQHGRRRIGFIRGPAESSEAEARYRAYRRALTDHQIEIEDRLIVNGSLGRDSGMSAVAELFDKRHLTPALIDGIIGVNDDVARGALDELKRRNIIVPNQLVVAGFDDAISAASANPPLTTVNQLVEQQAHAAVESLIVAIKQGQAPKSVVLPSKPIFRASCGCASENSKPSRVPRAVGLVMAKSLRLGLIERRIQITAELSRAAAGRVANAVGWEPQLLDSLAQELLGTHLGEFLAAFVALTRRHASAGRDVACFHEILTALRTQVVALAAIEPALLPQLEDLFQQAREALARIAVDIERSRQEMLNLRVRMITKECLALFGSGKTADLASKLEEHLPSLGIESFVISKFEANRAVSAELKPIARRSTGLWRAQSHLVYAKDLGIDPVLEQQEVLLVEPLDFDNAPVGIAVFGWGAHVPEHYEQLREVLSAAMQALAMR